MAVIAVPDIYVHGDSFIWWNNYKFRIRFDKEWELFFVEIERKFFWHTYYKTLQVMDDYKEANAWLHGFIWNKLK